MSYVTDTKFLVGVAVGFFALPYATKWVRSMLDKSTAPAA